MEITKNQAKTVSRNLNIRFSKKNFTLNDFTEGMNVELEHGTIHSSTNVTGDDLELTGKIALAHLNENPDYYLLLAKYVE